MNEDVCWPEDESSSAVVLNIAGNAIRVGLGKGMPVLSKDGRVMFLGDEQEDLFDKKLGSALLGSVSGVMNLPFRQPYLKGYSALAAPQELDVVEFFYGQSHSRGYGTHVELSEDDVRRQILEVLRRKGIAVAAPTELELAAGSPRETDAATSVASCRPDMEVGQLLKRIEFLEAQLRSNVPYLQMYKFGAGSLLVALVSLLVWLFTGTGAPFHPIFAAMVIPAAIGLMVMAFLVRRDIPKSAEEKK